MHNVTTWWDPCIRRITLFGVLTGIPVATAIALGLYLWDPPHLVQALFPIDPQNPAGLALAWIVAELNWVAGAYMCAISEAHRQQNLTHLRYHPGQIRAPTARHARRFTSTSLISPSPPAERGPRGEV